MQQSLAERDGATELPEDSLSSGEADDLLVRAALEQLEAMRRILRQQPTEQALPALVADARGRLLHHVGQSPQAMLRECGAGCCACCYTATADVMPLEAIVTARFLRRYHPRPPLATIITRLSEVVRHRRGLPARKQHVRLRCALLNKDNRCSAYQARPLACTGFFSFSREACETALRRQGDTDGQVPLDLPAKVWAMGVSAALQRAFSGAGLDSNLYELNSAVLQALECPDALRRWLRGEDVFRDCLCTDAHSPPRTLQATVGAVPTLGQPAPAVCPQVNS